jgi:Mn2+/Fe2+ NRAMP family transporter
MGSRPAIKRAAVTIVPEQAAGVRLGENGTSSGRRGIATHRWDLAFLLFALGIIGTGLLAIPVLAGSAAYAVAELLGWPSTLEARFPEAIGFQMIILAATIIGFAIVSLPINPIQLLVWTAVINGIVAVPIMAVICSHHGGDDVDRDKQQGDGSFSSASNVRLGRLERDGADEHYCGSLIWSLLA